MNLVPTPEERDAYRQAFADLHDTFSRPIVVMTSEAQTVISTDPNFNGFYRNQAPAPNIQYDVQSGTFNARIKYLSSQEVMQTLAGLKGTDGQEINVQLGAVRIRVDPSGYNFMKSATEINFDDEKHQVFQRDRGHGLFGIDYYDFILQRIP